MNLITLHTKRLSPGDDLVAALSECGEEFRSGDVVVISSKAVATCEGRTVDLKSLDVTKEAEHYAALCGRSPGFCQAVLEETRVRNGTIVGTCPGAMVTEVRPSLVRLGRAGLVARMTGARKNSDERRAMSEEPARDVVIITANAGLDESNIQKGFAIGWPEDPVESVGRLRKMLEKHTRAMGYELRAMSEVQSLPTAHSPQLKAQSSQLTALVISDSCVRPRRFGVTAFALTVSGIDPVQDQAGKNDLFGKPLRITKEAVADQLATAANMIMGNAGQGIPAVIVRDHGFALSDFEGWVPGIEPEEDLFRGIV